ncbi:MAG: flagellar hook-length control protein FliK [Caryophanon sp.]|nr:flagellar hook-length control protein FliK [Caryophanon sp.]
MTIAFTNLLQPTVKTVDVAAAKPATTQSSSSTTTTTSDRKFDDYLTSANEQPTSKAPVEATEATEVVERVEEVVSATTIEEVSEVIDLPIDENTLLVPIGPDGELVPIDELMNLEDIAALLNIDVAELEKMLASLLEEEVQLDSVWDLLTLVEEQGPELITKLTAALQGETKLVPKEVEKIVQFLKVVETLAPKTDVTPKQQQQLTTLQDAMKQLHVEVEQLVDDAPKQEAPKPLPFQQVALFQQKIVDMTIQQQVKAPQQAAVTTETEQPINVTTQQQAPKVQTVTITLPPTNQSAQSEALAKEMQAIIQRQQIANQQGTIKLAIKLYPENLGTVRLELMHKDGMLTARLMASTAVGKEMLESQLQQLKQGLAAQNIQLERIEITQSLQDATRNMNSSDQHLFNNFFKNEDEQEDVDDEQVEEQPSFEDFLEQVKEGEL